MPKYSDFDLDLENEPINPTIVINPKATVNVNCTDPFNTECHSVCVVCPYTFDPECKTEYCPIK